MMEKLKPSWSTDSAETSFAVLYEKGFYSPDVMQPLGAGGGGGGGGSSGNSAGKDIKVDGRVYDQRLLRLQAAPRRQSVYRWSHFGRQRPHLRRPDRLRSRLHSSLLYGRRDAESVAAGAFAAGAFLPLREAFAASVTLKEPGQYLISVISPNDIPAPGGAAATTWAEVVVEVE